MFLISWRGRGSVAFLAIWLAVACMLIGLPKGDEMAFLTFAIGWIVAGVLCFVLGRKWNGKGDLHRFCGAKLQTWGIIYACIGLFLLQPAIQGLHLAASARRPAAVGQH